MRNLMSSLSPRAEKAAFVALLVLFYALAYAFEPGAFPEVLVRAFFWGAGFATGWGLAYLTPSPRPLGRHDARLVAIALGAAVMVVSFALPTVLGPNLGELGRGLLVGCFVRTFAGRRNDG